MALLAVERSAVSAVFDHYALRLGRPVRELDPGEGVEEPLKSMLSDLGAVASPPLSYTVSGTHGIFYVNLKHLKLFERIDAQAISEVAPFWMLEVHEGSSVSILSRHQSRQKTCEISGVYGEGIWIEGDCPFSREDLIARNEADAAKIRARSGDNYQPQEDYVPEIAFADLTGGVTYAGAVMEDLTELHGNLPTIDSREVQNRGID